MDEKLRAEYLRSRLKEMMRKVPQHINEANVGVVRDFKKWFMATQKQLDNSRTPLSKLESCYQSAESMYH